MADTKFSIVIVNFNKFNLLHNCLKSISNQFKKNNYEVIVIDNNSSESGLENIIFEFPKVKLIKNNFNAGFAAANNQGFKIAKGEYVVCLNNDTILTEDIITPLIKEIGKYNKPTIVGCQLLNTDLSLQESYHKFPSVWNLFCENFFLYKLFPKNERLSPYYYEYIGSEKYINVDVLKGAFFIVKREVLNKLNGFDEKFFFFTEETDLFYRFKKELNGEVRFYPKLSLIHHGGGTVDSMPWFRFENLIKSKIKFFQKHCNGIDYLLKRIILFSGIFARVFLYFFVGIFLVRKKMLKKSWLYFRLLFIWPKNEFK